MIHRCGNKAGHLSLLRNMVRELYAFILEEKKEAAFQRGEGIGLNPNLAGWGCSDGWAGYEPTNNNGFPQKQPSSSSVGGSRDQSKARNRNKAVTSWTLNNGPVGLAPVQQPKQKLMPWIPKQTERISPAKHSGPWMTMINGKAVPLSSGALAKPVNYPVGYAPVKQTKKLRGGGISRDRAKREAHKAKMRQIRAAIPPIQYDADGLSVVPAFTAEANSVPAEEDDNILMPPPSSRPKRQRKCPQRYSSSALEHWPDVPITCHCKNTSHTGFCASLSANHTPRYYNTLVPFGDTKLYRCPHCAALLLKSEATGPAAFAKCCAKGQVKMEQQFYELQRPFLRPAQRLQSDEEAHMQLDDPSKLLDNILNNLIMGRHPLASKFIKTVNRLNHELAFGTATTEQKPVPGGYQPVKINGMVTYRLSGLNPPRNPDGSTREELCGQVWTMNPDDAIELRKRRNLDAGLHLDVRLLGSSAYLQISFLFFQEELLELLHRLLAHPLLGHPLSGLYFHLKRVYEDARQQQAQGEGPPIDNLRIRLLTRGEVMRQNLPEVHNVHPHQLQLPESVDQLAQLFFVDGDDGLPPAAELGVMLKTRSGALTVLPWWDNWIDGALCPLLFPCGGSVWKPSLPLAKPDLAAPLPQQQSHEEFEEQHVVPTLNEEDVAWQHNPYVDEEEDILAEADDNGEGEQLLLDAEPKKAHHISRSQAARYMMQLRAPPRHAGPQQRNHWHDPHWLWWARRLAEFFVCLLNNRIDRDKFANIKKNQPEQRSMLPAHLVRHFEREAQKQLDQQGQPLGDRAQLGRIFLAPRTLRGSRAYYQLQFADAMAICRQLGAPHLLITFTMNSAAKEFDTMLWEGQRWYNRPDISDRLFIDKSKEFLKDIVQRQVMGPVKAWFYSVEHQERGLPHIHLCLILNFARMQMSMEDYIDDYISAEIPELPHDGDNSHAAKLQRLFRRFILDNMYHTCSPRYCLVDGKCTKHFPRPFAEQTVIDDRIVGVQYRRRPPAQSESERLKNPERFACAVNGKDNRFVVPHNRFLALKYRSHINVEWIQGDACIKYVLKYVMKGCQLAFVQIVSDTTATTAGTVVVNYDEFRQIRMARYQTPNEALLSIWGNKIVRKSHQVQHQRFHLPGQNRIVVTIGREEERADEERERIEAEQDQQTPLTAYFTLNTTIGPALAQEHTFLTMCNAYWYDRQANQWKQRAQQRKNHLAMLEAASAGNPEHQALRMLLLHVRGPTGWDVLYAGHATFVEAARAMGLLEDSSIWVNTILEALSGLPTFRRRLNWTAVLFANTGILDASSVLDRVLLDSRRLLTPRAMLQHGHEANRQYVLFRMELVFRLHGVVPGNFNSCCERLGLPAPVGFVMPPEDIIEAEFNAGDYGNRMWAQLMHGPDDQNDSATDGPMTTAQYAAKNAEFSPQLNDKQRTFLDAVCASVIRRRNATLEPAQQLFMLTGDGGTGKTFAYNALIARLKSTMACRLLATASTGIAAQLLFEGATLHSKLRVPIDIDDDTMPMLDYESDPAKLLRALELLIIDEISIADKNVINYVDKLLRSIDVANNEKQFGGKIVVFGGDWKQLLPVAESSGAVGLDNVNMAYWMSVKTTTWFTNKLVNIHRLTVNMRVTANQEDYRRTLKTWGTGVTVRTAATDDRRRPFVQLCKSLCLSSEDALIEFVFGDALKDPLANIEQLRGAAILCPLNKDTFKLNTDLMARISNAVPTSAHLSDRIYTSIDTVDPDSPIDVLALNVAERYIENIYGKTPPGMPEHSLQLKIGAVMMILALGDNIITCRYIQGPRTGTEFKMYRHRFRFGGRGKDVTRHGAVKWTRLQFPLRPGFVITTHKSQGQTLARVGVHLSSSQCFAHGQFYVAMSRVRSRDDIRVLTSARSSNCVQNWVVQAVVDKEDIEEARQYAGSRSARAPDTVDPDSPIDVLALNVAERYIENIYGKTPPGMPEHSLQLKIGAVMMVIKNISVAHALCNGTRVQILALGDNIITCRYIQGPRTGTEFKMYRHRFRFGGRGKDVTRHGAVKWTRLQFPLRPGFVITTHKSQGQTLARVGVHLSSSQCFAHGQFYVAMSRVRSSDDIRVLTSARSSNCVQNWVVQAVVDKEDIEEARQYTAAPHQFVYECGQHEGERASGQMSMLAEDMENLMSPEKKRGRPSKTSPPRLPAFERQQREKAEKKKRWSEMMAAEGRRQLQQAEEAQQCVRERQAAEQLQLEAEQRREQLQKRRGHITQLWAPQLPPNASTACPSPPQSPAPKGKDQGAAIDSVQEQSLDDFESATAGLSRAQLKRLPYNVAGQPSGDCCICKLEIRANNAITTLPCGHNNFHTGGLPREKETTFTRCEALVLIQRNAD
uniref:ATP-dependent DNA helicase n=1 Tax=Globodera pallida TaxID=36090 RepID=A0A183BU64_GLOPA